MLGFLHGRRKPTFACCPTEKREDFTTSFALRREVIRTPGTLGGRALRAGIRKPADARVKFWKWPRSDLWEYYGGGDVTS